MGHLRRGDIAGRGAWAERESDFWNRLRNGYMLGSEGRISILGNPDNGSVHYSKGSWIFHMFDLMLGDSGVRPRHSRRTCSARPTVKPAGYRELIDDMSHAADRDLTSFAMPWFTEKLIPDVRAHVSGRRLIVSQVQATPPYDLPLEIVLTTAFGHHAAPNRPPNTRRHLALRHRRLVVAVHVDPDDHLLLQRHWGEHVHLELPVSQAAGDTAVAIVGDFTLDSRAGDAPRRRVGGRSAAHRGAVRLSWQIDGKPRSVSRAETRAPMVTRPTTARSGKPPVPLPDGLPKGGMPIP